MKMNLIWNILQCRPLGDFTIHKTYLCSLQCQVVQLTKETTHLYLQIGSKFIGTWYKCERMMYWPGRWAYSIELYCSNVASLCKSLLVSEYMVWTIIMSYWIIWGFRDCGRTLNQFKPCSLITKFRKWKVQSSIIVSWYCSVTKGIPLLSVERWWIRPFENIYLAEWSGYICLIIASVSFVIVKPFW